MRSKQVPLGKLKVYEGNPRIIPEAAVLAVAESLSRFGWKQPIVADAKGVIVAGHVRFAAAKKLGYKSAPVVTISEVLADAYRLADNRTHDFSGWHTELLSDELAAVDLGEGNPWDFDSLVAPGASSAEEAVVSPDRDVAQAAAKPRAKRGELWELGDHRILCGDATLAEDVARLLGDVVPQCVLTDPPYSSGGFQESGKSAGSKGSDADYRPIEGDRRSTRGYIALMKQILSATPLATVLYCFTDWKQWVNLFDVSEGSGYGVRSMLVWNKGTPGMGMGWRSQHELILCATREHGLWKRHMGAQGNVLSCSRVPNELHATQKPVELLALILRTTPFADTVYDPFCGSGSTLIAGIEESRQVFLMEIDPYYVDVTVERWEKATGKVAVCCT